MCSLVDLNQLSNKYTQYPQDGKQYINLFPRKKQNIIKTKNGYSSFRAFPGQQKSSCSNTTLFQQESLQDREQTTNNRHVNTFYQKNLSFCMRKIQCKAYLLPRCHHLNGKQKRGKFQTSLWPLAVFPTFQPFITQYNSIFILVIGNFTSKSFPFSMIDIQQVQLQQRNKIVLIN